MIVVAVKSPFEFSTKDRHAKIAIDPNGLVACNTADAAAWNTVFLTGEYSSGVHRCVVRLLCATTTIGIGFGVNHNRAALDGHIGNNGGITIYMQNNIVW